MLLPVLIVPLFWIEIAMNENEGKEFGNLVGSLWFGPLYLNRSQYQNQCIVWAPHRDRNGNGHWDIGEDDCDIVIIPPDPNKLTNTKILMKMIGALPYAWSQIHEIRQKMKARTQKKWIVSSENILIYE